MEFKCLKDKLYLIILFSINIIFIFSIIVCLVYGLGLGTLSFSLLLGVFNWYFFSIYYVLGEEELIIKVMIFKKIIPYKEIVEVKQTANTISSFALSRQRIAIRTSEKARKFNYIYVSPQNENRFLEILLNKCKHTKNKSEE